MHNRLFENIGKGEFSVPKGDVDPVLESLIVGMLETDFNDRFTILQIKDHDWLKKKHPMDEPPVTITPRDPEDPMMSTSVIPYLVDLHFGDDAQNQVVDSEYIEKGLEHEYRQQHFQNNLVTEHDLREQEQYKEAQRQERLIQSASGNNSNGAKHSREQGLPKDKNKTTKCIKVKKMNNCLIS